MKIPTGIHSVLLSLFMINRSASQAKRRNDYFLKFALDLAAATAAAKSLQSCPTLCNPIDGSPPGSPIPGILQARTLEWVAICMKVKSLSRVQLLVTPWTAARQASPPMGFSRHEYWSGVPLPSPLHGLVTSKSPHPNPSTLKERISTY